MRLPICGTCLESEKLCENCDDRLQKGEIQHSDVELARAMSKVSEEHPQLEKAEFLKTQEEENKLAKQLSDKYGVGTLDIESGKFTPQA